MFKSRDLCCVARQCRAAAGCTRSVRLYLLLMHITQQSVLTISEIYWDQRLILVMKRVPVLKGCEWSFTCCRSLAASQLLQLEQLYSNTFIMNCQLSHQKDGWMYCEMWHQRGREWNSLSFVFAPGQLQNSCVIIYR